MDTKDYGLDLHCQMILDEYRDNRYAFEKILEIAQDTLRQALKTNNILVTAVEGRVKKEASLAGKLELKGSKYRTLSDLTDIAGIRVITFYTDDVDKIASLTERIFEVDWDESVDKRKMHELNSFGYMSLHYICRIPASLYFDEQHPEINEYRWELQMRTALQHMWANMYHDTGYKSGVEIPVEYLRNLNRLAGMLELADDEFSRIRKEITDYRRHVQDLVQSGSFAEVKLNGDTFRSYLELGPFDKLTKRIAAINQAEIMQTSAMPYLEVLKALGFKTLGDIEELIGTYSEDAFLLARHEIGNTDLDIISSTVAIQDLLVVRILENGGGERGLKFLFDTVSGPGDWNAARAARVMQTASGLSFMRKKKD